jgi:polysaccharide biosynthesis protein PslH
MNILFLTQILPYPPTSGPKVKTWHVLRYLFQKGHDVTLVSFVRPEEEQHIPVVREICKEVHAVPIQRSRIADAFYVVQSYLTGRPFLVERDDLRPMQDKVNQLVRENDFQFIHADQLTMVQFAIRGASLLPEKRPKVIFDAHNAVWTIVERMKENAHFLVKPFLTVEANRVKQYEGELLRLVDHVLTVTDIDRNLLEEALSFSKPRENDHVSSIKVIPIAVDTEKLQPVKRRTDSKNIVTLGTLHYPPNADGIRWFLNEVFPLVREHVPDATLTIIGKNPPQDFIELAERNPGVIKVTGYVDDLRPYLEESALMVVPVRAGGGMRVRILEAFSYAMPVVTTTVGLEGISGMPEHDVLVADTPVDFADRTIELLDDPSLQEKLSTNGRELVTKCYNWRAVLSAMKPIYE